MSDDDKRTEDLAAENERLRAELAQMKATGGGGGWDTARRWLSPIAGVLAVLLIIATTIGVWVNRTVWNEEKYVERVVPVAGDPAVIEVMATQLTDQAMLALNVEGRVRDALGAIAQDLELPEQVAFLAGPLTESIRGLVHDQAVNFLSSDAFQTYWKRANEELHPKIVALLRADYESLPNLVVGEEVVQIDLIPILAKILRDLVDRGIEGLDLNVTIPEIAGGDPRAAVETLSRALGVPLPEDFGQITVMTTADLESYQQTAGLLRAVGWGLLFLSVVMIALTLVLAHDRRRALVWLGLGTTAGVIVATVVLRNIKEAILASIDSAQAQDAARAVVEQFGSSLRTAGAWVAWISLIIAVIAYLTGRPPWVRAGLAWARESTSKEGVSQLEAWVGANADTARVVAIGLAVLVLFLVGIGLLSAVLVGGVLALALWGTAVAQNRARAPEEA